MSHWHWVWGQFQAHIPPNLVFSMGPTILVMTFKGLAKFVLEKVTSKLAVAGNGTVCGQCMSIVISWSNRMECICLM